MKYRETGLNIDRQDEIQIDRIKYRYTDRLIGGNLERWIEYRQEVWKDGEMVIIVCKYRTKDRKHRQVDREIGRKTDRQIEIQLDIQRGRETDRQRDIQVERQIGREIDSQRDRQVERQTYR